MIDSIRGMDKLTRAQYLLMLVFGSVTVVGGFAPLGLTTRVAITGVALGVTIGLWLSHLLKMLHLSIYQAKTQPEGGVYE